MSFDTKWDIGNFNGKTTRMIERASEENLFIVVPNRRRADIIFKMARDMWRDILFPVTVRELPFKAMGNPYCMTHPGVLVDDVDAVLEKFIGMPVVGAASRGVIQSEQPRSCGE